ncbi:unnamed protein product [Diplocarpon coronariae]
MSLLRCRRASGPAVLPLDGASRSPASGCNHEAWIGLSVPTDISGLGVSVLSRSFEYQRSSFVWKPRASREASHNPEARNLWLVREKGGQLSGQCPNSMLLDTQFNAMVSGEAVAVAHRWLHVWPRREREACSPVRFPRPDERDAMTPVERSGGSLQRSQALDAGLPRPGWGQAEDNSPILLSLAT